MNRRAKKIGRFECVILAGGQGTRLRKIISDRPKPLAPIAGRPFLDILMASLIRSGCGRFILSVGFMAEKIVSRYGNKFLDVDIDYSLECEPLGTGGGLRKALRMRESDVVVAVNGDTFLEMDYGDFAAHPTDRRLPLLAAAHVPDASRYGTLLLEGGGVKAFLEKDQTGPGLINAGCYRLPGDALDKFPPSTQFSLEKDYLAPLAARNPIPFYPCAGLFIDIGVPEDYERAESCLAATDYGLLP